MKFVPGLGGGDGEQVAKFKFSVYLKNVQFFGEMAGSVAFPAATIPTSWASGAPGAATAPHSSNIALLFFYNLLCEGECCVGIRNFAQRLPHPGPLLREQLAVGAEDAGAAHGQLLGEDMSRI